jgi:Trypsin-like peptidase domain
MWDRLIQVYRWLFRVRDPRLSPADLEDMDVGFEGPLTLLEHERFVVEGGKFAATAAVFCDGDITRTPGNSIDGYIPGIACLLTMHRVNIDFDPAKESLLAASKATSLLVIEWTDKKKHGYLVVATAFFVGPSVLLTAGHAVLKPEEAVSIEYYLFPAGTEFISLADLVHRRPVIYPFEVIENASVRSNLDLAILKTAVQSSYFVDLSTQEMPIDGTADIIGYPGEKRERWIRKHPGLADSEIENSEKTAEELLPKRTLVVTRGIVQHHNGCYTLYKISTCPGLSGSPVVYEGKVHGI